MSKNEYAPIRVRKAAIQELMSFAGELQTKLKRKVSVSEAIDRLLKYRKNVLGEEENKKL